MTYTPTKWVNGGKPAINAENLNKIEAELARLSKVVSVPDITETTSTTQPNSYAGREMVLEIGGVTEQGENPSPTNPQEIKKSVVSGVRTHWKNFFPSKAEVGTISPENGIEAEGATFLRTPFKKITSGDYYLSLVGDKSALRIFYYDANLKYVGYVDANYNSIKVPDGVHYFRARWSPNTSDLKNIQLEEGTVATPYEPYTESSYTFSQPIELYGMGDVQDVITPKEIGRKFGVAVFDGSDDEDWVANETMYQGKYRALTSLPSARQTYEKPRLLCSHYMTTTPSANYSAIEGISTGAGSSVLIVYDENYNTADISLWRAYLQANPITVVYEFATPTTEALPIADQIGLNSLATYDGITYVEFIYEGPQPTLKAEYGTSKVGGYTLEAMLAGRNGELRGV